MPRVGPRPLFTSWALPRLGFFFWLLPYPDICLPERGTKTSKTLPELRLNIQPGDRRGGLHVLGGQPCFLTGKLMRLVMLPKTLGKGIPCASQRTFPNAFPTLPPVWDQRLKAPMWASPKSVFLFWGTGISVALSSFVCLGDILHTFAQAPAILVLLGAALGSSCLLSNSQPEDQPQAWAWPLPSSPLRA